ncbi:hypothetical protein CLOSCI_03538 [[Clostridium] scindens ATCC 35704]|uniref:Uncharacterized protein n=1 Tax=Clostridium scindens (strain ATCC 35704 / DSM 5676 / VPI 13733 / 19) TaxID=411468 RepID=B0NJ59_CLOS5|nr:hypothetical protein [[Clostridium] scindens]EDS05389.1 hypothetical protein CLOSCI_03538 [[Clostridium] scindens ATCC 35704]QBF75133.1 hypothetical protein HDCHBGLK_02542 [[Clostridium] scindens ATCC 35704]QRO38291.1 hypothetical protein I6J57_06485 [[Clostridium] scindens]BDF16162.1 hypothetical protein CE91St59_14250 [[Clostridium] scindens]BDF19859.1 hypothetical protein CE91St60_14420 [[Clostridium] scindens]
MEKEIIRITIKGSSGYCSYEYVYEDRLSLTSDSISYEFVPALNSHIRKPRKWSYKSNNPEFKKSFKAIAEGVKEALVNETIAFCTDVGGIEFIVSYDDRSRDRRQFWCTAEDFKELFALIKRLVPAIEEVPETLKTNEDYEDSDL